MQRRRAPGAGDLPGGHVRRPVRRLRRLPGVSTATRVPAAGHQARALGQGRGPAAARRLRRHAGRARACRSPPRSSWCSATAPRRATGSTSCCRSTGPAARPCSGCSTTTSPAARRCRWEDEDVRACFRCPGVHDPGPRARRPAAGRRHAGQPARPADRRGHHHHQRPRRATTAPVPELSARTVDGADRTGPAAAGAARRRQAALRDRRRAAVDGAARRGQGRPVLRLRG